MFGADGLERSPFIAVGCCFTLQILPSRNTNRVWAFFYWVLHSIMLSRILPSFEDNFTLWSWNGKKFRDRISDCWALSTCLQLWKTQRKICYAVTGLATWKGRSAIGSLLAHPVECTKTAEKYYHFSCSSHSARRLFAGDSARFSASCNCSSVKSGKCPSLKYVTILPRCLLLHIWMFCILSWRHRGSAL